MLEGRYLFFGDDLTDARRIRYEVFEKEQKVPHEIEFDNLDDEAIHVVVYEDQKPVGTGRLLFDGENYKIGRIAVIKEERGKKYGDFVVRMLIDKAFLMGAKRVYANVQLHSDVYKRQDIELSGEEMGVLIGKRGQTLDSLQYLTSLVANRESANYIRVKVDTENYRERRKETLENLAKNIAYKVKRTKRSVSLEPMNQYERRVIHSALQNDKYVNTHSEGEEPFRRVVVTLKKQER